MTVNDCTHPYLRPHGSTSCTAWVLCEACGFQESRARHLWVPAGIDNPQPRVCVYCDVEQMSDA